MAGKPTLVIQNGKILEGNMKGMRYTLDYLNQQLREKDIFDISEVEFAMIETDGHMSVKNTLRLKSHAEGPSFIHGGRALHAD